MGHADVSTAEIYAHYAPDPTGGVMFAQKAFGGADGTGDGPSLTSGTSY